MSSHVQQSIWICQKLPMIEAARSWNGTTFLPGAVSLNRISQDPVRIPRQVSRTTKTTFWRERLTYRQVETEQLSFWEWVKFIFIIDLDLFLCSLFMYYSKPITYNEGFRNVLIQISEIFNCWIWMIFILLFRYIFVK